jgi:hypothetical protein
MREAGPPGAGHAATHVMSRIPAGVFGPGFFLSEKRGMIPAG